MRVLISLKKGPPQKYLIRLVTKYLIKEVRELINDQKHSEAVTTIFTKGVLQREIFKEDAHSVEADLILSEDNARRDISK